MDTQLVLKPAFLDACVMCFMTFLLFMIGTTRVSVGGDTPAEESRIEQFCEQEMSLSRYFSALF